MSVHNIKIIDIKNMFEWWEEFLNVQQQNDNKKTFPTCNNNKATCRETQCNFRGSVWGNNNCTILHNMGHEKRHEVRERTTWCID